MVEQQNKSEGIDTAMLFEHWYLREGAGCLDMMSLVSKTIVLPELCLCILISNIQDLESWPFSS